MPGVIAYQRVPAFTSTTGLSKLVAAPQINAGSKFFLDLSDTRSYAQAASTETLSNARTFTDLVSGGSISIQAPDALVNRGFNGSGKYLGLGFSVGASPVANANAILMPANTALPIAGHDWLFAMWVARTAAMPSGRSYDALAFLSGAAATGTNIDMGVADKNPRVNFNGGGGGNGGQGPALVDGQVTQLAYGYKITGGAAVLTIYVNNVAVVQTPVALAPVDVSASALTIGNSRGSFILYEAFAEDLTVSGQSAADALAIDYAYSQPRFATS
jgi:hypothetical protein